jgi:regulator of sirC expression with transglutaminase-like and TPR domain
MATQNRAVLDALTNELVYVEMTQEELDQLTTDNEAAAANISSKQADKSAILEKLGITAEEAELLLS